MTPTLLNLRPSLDEFQLLMNLIEQQNKAKPIREITELLNQVQAVLLQAVVEGQNLETMHQRIQLRISRSVEAIAFSPYGYLMDLKGPIETVMKYRMAMGNLSWINGYVTKATEALKRAATKEQIDAAYTDAEGYYVALQQMPIRREETEERSDG